MEGTGARAGICGAGSAGMGKGIWGGWLKRQGGWVRVSCVSS